MSDLVRTQILLNRNQRIVLRLIAQKEGRSVSEIVRDAIDVQLRRRRYLVMQEAAELLKSDYEANGELTNMTILDGEDFIDA
ncbi:MAG: hypothetical protein MUO64_00530 [Anaerolineales bacterium]|nr:hypothetical protein [Anaerolineales bacterium]